MIKLGEDRKAAAHYFANLADHPSSHRSKASFHRLGNRPSPSEVSGLLPPPTEPLQEETTALLAGWLPVLQAGFNLCIHGFGSKIALLDKFMDGYCSIETIVFRAYKRDANFNAFMEAVGSLFGIDQTCKTPIAHAKKILELSSNREAPLLLLIHQIDAVILRSETCQQALALLSQHPSIRMLASCDHVNTASLWSPAQQYSFNFIWQDATTFSRYGEELAIIIDGRTRGRQAGKTTAANCKAVLKVLPDSAQRAFRILAEHQLSQSTESAVAKIDDHEDSDGDIDYADAEDDDDIGGNDEAMARKGLAYHEWYTRCLQHLFITSEPAFRTQLAEFVDHHLVVGVESPSMAGLAYYLPFTTKELRDIIACLAH